jgi:hypothetical protein
VEHGGGEGVDVVDTARGEREIRENGGIDGCATLALFSLSDV